MASNKNDSTVQAQPVTAKINQVYSITLREGLGKLWVDWTLSSEGQPNNKIGPAHYDMLIVYTGPVPSDPTGQPTEKAWVYTDTVNNPGDGSQGSWNTNLPWGSGYSGAWVRKTYTYDHKHGTFFYLCYTPETTP